MDLPLLLRMSGGNAAKFVVVLDWCVFNMGFVEVMYCLVSSRTAAWCMEFCSFWSII